MSHASTESFASGSEYTGRNITARQVALRLGGFAIALGGAFLSDNYIGKHMWLDELPPVEPYKSQPSGNHLAINYGGLHVASVAKMFGIVNKTIGKYAQVQNCNSSNKGLPIEDVQRRTLGIIERKQPDKIILNGHSKGGMVAVDVASYLNEKGIKVDGITRIGSPTVYEQDVRAPKRRQAERMCAANDRNLRGGPATRVFSEIYSGLSEGKRGRQEYFALLKEAWENLSSTSCSIGLMAEDIKYMKGFNAEKSFSGLHQDTKVYHMSPEDLTADKTVDNASSTLNEARVMGGRYLCEMAIAGAKHADINNPTAAYGPAFEEVLDDLGFIANPTQEADSLILPYAA